MTEKICGKCHLSKPREEHFNKDKSQEDGFCRYCRACRTEKRQQWYVEHKVEKAAADKAYRERNKEKVLARAAQYRANNAEQVKAYFRNRYATDPEFAKHKKQASEEWRKANPERHKKRRREYKAKHRRRMHLKAKFGLTLEQYDQMVIAQNGLCAICLRPPTGIYPDKLGVDHCHTTGKVRALLCRDCNSALGLFQDNAELLQKAAEYLARHA